MSIASSFGMDSVLDTVGGAEAPARVSRPAHPPGLLVSPWLYAGGLFSVACWVGLGIVIARLL